MTITQEQLDTIKPGTVWKATSGSEPEVTIVLVTNQHLGTLDDRIRSMVIIRTGSNLLGLSPKMLLKHYRLLGSTKAEKKLGYMHKIVAYMESHSIVEFMLTLELVQDGNVSVNGELMPMAQYSKLLELVRTFISHKTRISRVNYMTITKVDAKYILRVESLVEHTDPISYVGVTNHTFELTGEDHE